MSSCDEECRSAPQLRTVKQSHRNNTLVSMDALVQMMRRASASPTPAVPRTQEGPSAASSSAACSGAPAVRLRRKTGDGGADGAGSA